MKTYRCECGQIAISSTFGGEPLCADCQAEGYGQEDTPMTKDEWLEKADAELAFVEMKLRCLTAFIGTDRVKEADRELAEEQHKHMVGYRDILTKRISNARN